MRQDTASLRCPVQLVGIVAALIATGLPGAAAAQSYDIGVTFGHTVFWQNAPAVAGFDETETGSLFGLEIRKKVSDLLQLETGVLWLRKGGSGFVRQAEGGLRWRGELSENHLQMPLLARLSPFPGAPLRPSLAAGPAVSFEIECNYRERIPEVTVDAGCASDRRRFDVGLLGGGGLAWNMFGVAVVLDVRYEMGLLERYPSSSTRQSGVTATATAWLPFP